MRSRERPVLFRKAVLALLFWGVQVGKVRAGLLIDATIMYPAEGKTARLEGRIIIEGSYLKFAPASPAIGREFLYVAGTGESTIVDHAARTYYTVPPSAVTAFGKTATVARKFRSRLMELLNPRKSEERRLSVWSTDKTISISGLTCRRYVVYTDDVLVQDVWTARWEEAGVSPGEVACLRDFLQKYEHSFSALLSIVGCEVPEGITLSGILQIGGYPVFVRQYTSGHPRHAVLLSRPRVTHASVKEFIPPHGYTRRL